MTKFSATSRFTPLAGSDRCTNCGRTYSDHYFAQCPMPVVRPVQEDLQGRGRGKEPKPGGCE